MSTAPDPNNEMQTAGEAAIANAPAETASAPAPTTPRRSADAGVAAGTESGPGEPWPTRGFEPASIGRVALVGLVLLAVPAVSAYLVGEYIGNAHRDFDEQLRTAGGAIDPAGVLAWSTASDGPLYVGLNSGKLVRIDRDATTAETIPVFAEQELPMPIVDIEVSSDRRPLPVLLYAGNPDDGRLFVVDKVQTIDGLVAVSADGSTLLTGTRQASPQQSAPPQTGLEQWKYEANGDRVDVGPISGIDDVRAVATLPGSSFMIAGDGKGGVFRIDASQQVSGVNPDQYITRIGGHEAAITRIEPAAASSGSGAMFVSAAADGSVKAWFSDSELEGTGRAQACCSDPVDVIYPSDVWAQTGTASSGWSELLAMSEDGRYVALLDMDRRLAVLDRRAADGSNIRRSANPVVGDVAVAFRPRHAELLVEDLGTQTSTATLRSVDDLDSAIRTFTLGPGGRNELAFDQTGSALAIASSNGSFTRTNLDSSDNAGDWRASLQERATALTFSPDRSLIVVGSEAGQIDLYNAVDGERLATIPPRNGDKGQVFEPRTATVSEDGKRLTVAYSPDLLVLYSIRTLRQLDVSYYDSPLSVGRYHVVFALGSKVFVAPLGERASATFDTASATNQSIRDLRVDAAGRTVALLSSGGDLTIWEPTVPASGLDLHAAEPMPIPTPDADGLKLSADGSTVLLHQADGKLYIAALGRDAATSVLPYLRPFQADIRAADVALNRSGSTVLIALPNGDLQAVRLNWIATADEPAPQTTVARDTEVVETILLPGHGAMIDHLAVSPDGAWLATASIDGRLRVTNVERARQIAGWPLASLAAGPQPAAMQPETLFDSPYAFLDETLVLKVQRGLQKAGYDVGPPDGTLGAVTRTRISEYQAAAGLPQTGEPDRALYAHMKAAGLFDAKAAAE